MKLAWALIVVGVLLFTEGTIRMSLGVLGADLPLVIGGILTGLLLGSFLFYRGIRRYQRLKKPLLNTQRLFMNPNRNYSFKILLEITSL